MRQSLGRQVLPGKMERGGPSHEGHPLFFVDQFSTHTWLPRRPQLFTDVLATASRPAAPPCTPRPVFTGATASIFPMALFLGGASHKALRHGAPTSSFPMVLRHGAPASSTSATAPRPATNLTRRRKVLWFG